MRQQVSGGTPDQTASAIIDRYNAFADHSAIRESYHPGARFQLCIDNKTGNQAGVQCANIAHHIPRLLDRRFHRDLFVYRRHFLSIDS
jgi:hypothetical protein